MALKDRALRYAYGVSLYFVHELVFDDICKKDQF